MSGNSTGILPPLPPQIDEFVHWLFGPGWWFWLGMIIIVLAVYVGKSGFKKQIMKDESKTVSMPSAKEYLEGEGKEEEEAGREEGLIPDSTSPRLRPEPPLRPNSDSEWEKTWRENGTDPNMAKINDAFEAAKDRAVDELVDAIKRLRLKITLPERNDRNKILNVTLPEKPLPIEQEEESP